MCNFEYKSVIDIVKVAGHIIKKNWDNTNIIHEKSPYNYVTDMDKIVQDYIIQKLTQINKHWEFISEESVSNSYNLNNTWVIDPIDGTTNFIHKYPHFSISMAHMVNDEIKFSVIYNPISDELYKAEKGRGAFLNGSRIRVSNTKTLNKSIIAVGLPYDREKTDIIFNIMKNLYMNCEDIKRKGSASLDLAYVACGRLDGYLELDLKLWDVAAGCLLISEAGGIVTNLNKIPLCENTDVIIASNSILNNEILAILKRIQASGKICENKEENR